MSHDWKSASTPGVQMPGASAAPTSASGRRRRLTKAELADMAGDAHMVPPNGYMGTQRCAAFPWRAVSALIDWTLVWVGGGLMIGGLLWEMAFHQGNHGGLDLVGMGAVALVNLSWQAYGRRGQSIGKWITRTQLVRPVQDREGWGLEAVSLPLSIWRSCLHLFDVFFLIGWLRILVNPLYQTFADQWTHTLVMRLDGGPVDLHPAGTGGLPLL